MDAREAGAGLQFRNALNDFDHAASDVVAQGTADEPPFVTIAIPTYRRPEFLIEAVQSALGQQFDRPIEIIVVDNDPESQGAATLLAKLPQLNGANFRYYVNRENIGLYANWNRCIQLARGEWLSILNDDDLLYPDSFSTMFGVIDRNPRIEALNCYKRTLCDNEADSSRFSVPLPKRVGRRLLHESLFLGADARKITPRKFFWGSMFGNSAGFICKRQKAVEVGGFYPEEFPSADYWFYLRLSKIADFRQYRGVAASVRVADNETGNPVTVRKSLEASHRLKQALLGTEVPRWWRHLSPMVSARDQADYCAYWGVNISKQEVEQMLDIRLPKHRPYLLWGLRLLLRGF